MSLVLTFIPREQQTWQRKVSPAGLDIITYTHSRCLDGSAQSEFWLRVGKPEDRQGKKAKRRQRNDYPVE